MVCGGCVVSIFFSPSHAAPPPSVGLYDQSTGRASLSDRYEYVMHGRVYRIEDDKEPGKLYVGRLPHFPFFLPFISVDSFPQGRLRVVWRAADAPPRRQRDAQADLLGRGPVRVDAQGGVISARWVGKFKI